MCDTENARQSNQIENTHKVTAASLVCLLGVDGFAPPGEMSSFDLQCRTRSHGLC